MDRTVDPADRDRGRPSDETDETNSKDEKAEYIRQAFDGVRGRLLGDLHEESYVYVQDVRAAAYGYGGKTQEFRYQRGS